MRLTGIISSLATAMLVGACNNGGGDSTRDRQIDPPASPSVSVSANTKQLLFGWNSVAGATYYRLLENPDGHSGFTQSGGDIPAGMLSITKNIAVHLHDWSNALYIVQACNSAGCTGSTESSVTEMVQDSIGYLKASNAEEGDSFGTVALSGDGMTLAVGAWREDGGATGVNGDEGDNSIQGSGAVYVFTFNGTTWSQDSYIKALNPDTNDHFGYSVDLSDDGKTLAVGSYREDSSATEMDGDRDDNSAEDSGAAYVFQFDGATWEQMAYIKASNTEAGDHFGGSMALSGDGTTLAIGAIGEDSAAKGLNGDQSGNGLEDHGAVYILRRDGTTWSQQEYIKDNTDRDNCGGGNQTPHYLPLRFGLDIDLNYDGNILIVGDGCMSFDEWGAAQVYQFDGESWNYDALLNRGGWKFGTSVAINADGNTLAVGAPGRSIWQFENGEVTVYRRGESSWARQTVIHHIDDEGGDESEAGQNFGVALELSADGDTLAVGVKYEDSMATGINGDRTTTSTNSTGAVYVYQFDGTGWIELTYVKASNTDEGDYFGGRLGSVALSADGSTLAVGAHQEDSAAIGINGDQSDNSADESGAVYVY